MTASTLYKESQYQTLTTAKVPAYRGTFKPRMCLTWLVKTKIAAPVVKPLMIGSDKYTATKPSFRKPITNCRKTIYYNKKSFTSKSMFKRSLLQFITIKHCNNARNHIVHNYVAEQVDNSV